ncbi:MAG: response regulator [bacterium]|nr:response regulator [bacterium]
MRALVIRSEASGRAPLIDWLSEHGEVATVESLEDGLQLMQKQTFDLVVASPADLCSSEGVALPPQATAILESVTQGVCIVEQGGRLVWANPRMLDFSDEIRERVCSLCAETFSWATSESARRPTHVRGRRFSFTTANQEYIELTATPVIDLNNRVTQVAAVVWDATQARRMQEQIDAIDNAGRELVRLDAEEVSRLNAHERLDLLEQKIIRYTRELMDFDNFAVLVLDKSTNKLDVVLSAGLSQDIRRIDVYSGGEGNGISGYVAHTGRSYICPDVRKDPRYLQGIPNARSSLTIPLRLHDHVIGVFNIESQRPAAFTEDDRQCLQIFGRHLAVALHMLDLLVSERHSTTGQLGVDVMAEITSPLNDILTITSNLIEDYIGHDELRHRLNQITDNAVALREAIKTVTTPQRGLLSVRGGARGAHRDPVLSDKRLLVADDEEVIRETIRDVLASNGCEVHTAEDGEEALELIAAHEFDLVLSDIKMPGKTGYEVFSAAKDSNPDCPVIFMTGFGYDPNHTIVRARREGLAAVLFKPFKVDQLLGEIRSAIRATQT